MGKSWSLELEFSLEMETSKEMLRIPESAEGRDRFSIAGFELVWKLTGW